MNRTASTTLLTAAISCFLATPVLADIGAQGMGLAGGTVTPTIGLPAGTIATATATATALPPTETPIPPTRTPRPTELVLNVGGCAVAQANQTGARELAIFPALVFLDRARRRLRRR